MSVFALFDAALFDAPSRTAKPHSPKNDWPLMGDVATCRAGVPEALIQWRKARGEDAPEPNDPKRDF